MELISTIFYFLIVIGILVFIHEFGHFAAARLTGMRAEVFALGMGYRLFGFNKVNGFTFGKLKEGLEMNAHTDYRLCAFPIGGYVKVSGMIDESMDKSVLESEPKPWEYRSKPVWKRMIVITAGVIMNILLAFLIFYSITLFKGKSATASTTIGYISNNTPAQNSGLQSGDKIISINGKEVSTWEEVSTNLYFENLGEALSFTVLRDGSQKIISVPKDKVGDLTERNFGIYVDNVQPEINEVLKGRPADKVGIQKNDVITDYAGVKLNSAQQLTELIKANVSNETEIGLKRNDQPLKLMIKADPDSTIGVSIASKYTGPIKKESYNVFTAAPKAAGDMYYLGIELFVKTIVKIFKGEVAFKKAIGGPVKIAQASAQSAEGGFFSFIGFLALLSISLAVINILPFPALDGGHFMLLMYEGIVKKPVPYKVQVVIQNVGFAILLMFMIFVLYNDIISIK
ncbi:RIP metalloprotease RseP [soil metagenome]